MKKCLRFLALSLIFAIFTISCRSDSDEDKNAIPAPTYLNGFIQKDGGAKIRMNIALVNGSKYNVAGEENVYGFSFGAVEVSDVRSVAFAIKFPSTTSINGNYTSSSSSKIIDSSIYGELNNTDYIVTSATSTITRNSTTNFTLEFKLTLSNGSVVNGEFSDEIAIVETTF